MHDLDFEHDHQQPDALRLAIAEAIWEQETVDMLTVGIDIGSSTTHLLFARVIMRRQQFDLSSRFVVTERRIVWRSPIMLTPFLPDGTIDAQALQRFFRDCYEQAGYERSDVDSGAVILTGEAIKRRNARAIDEIFAAESGRFVCATAGHRLESILAVHGSGATRLSSDREQVGLHVDIGGGTTKLAIVNNGEIASVCAFAVGGRLLARDERGDWTRIDDSARLVAQSLGFEPTPRSIADPTVRGQIVKRLATLAVDQISGTPLDDLGRNLLLTEPLDRTLAPQFISFSGGVSEYIFNYEDADFGDVARDLAKEIVAQIPRRIDIPIIDAGHRIRATVIGASQFTVQVSGKTLYLNDPLALPAHNVPVIHLAAPLEDDIDVDAIASAFREAAVQHDYDIDQMLALAFKWTGMPDYARLRAMGEAIMKAVAPMGGRENLLALVIDGDVGQSIGRIIDKELNYRGNMVCLDGVQLKDLDFVDIGELLDPPGVVPIVIKSLLFS